MPKKKKMNRREFAKLAGGAALLAPVGLAALDARAAALQATAAAQAAAAPQDAAKPGPKLSAEQEERVKQSRERTERQLRGLHERPLAYDAEPAFAFRAIAAKRKS